MKKAEKMTSDTARDLTKISSYRIFVVAVIVNNKAVGMTGIYAAKDEADAIRIANLVDPVEIEGETIRAFETKISILDPFANKLIERELNAYTNLTGKTVDATDLFAFHSYESIISRASRQADERTKSNNKKTKLRLSNLNDIIRDLRANTKAPVLKELEKVVPIKKQAPAPKVVEPEGLELPRVTIEVASVKKPKVDSKRARKA